jgi:hypothetical protein
MMIAGGICKTIKVVVGVVRHLALGTSIRGVNKTWSARQDREVVGLSFP